MRGWAVSRNNCEEIITKQKKICFRRLEYFYSCDSLALSLTNNECNTVEELRMTLSCPSPSISLNNKTSNIIIRSNNELVFDHILPQFHHHHTKSQNLSFLRSD